MKKPLLILIALGTSFLLAAGKPQAALAVGGCTISNFKGDHESPVPAGTVVHFSADVSCPAEVDSVTYTVRSTVVPDGSWNTNGFTFGPGTYTVTARAVSKDDPNGMLPTRATLTYVVSGTRPATTGTSTSSYRRTPSAPVMGSRIKQAVQSIQAILPNVNIRVRSGASLQSQQIGVLPYGWYLPYAQAISNGFYQIKTGESSYAWITADPSLTRLVE